MRDLNSRLQKIDLKLQGFKFTVMYRPGRENANADYLSRLPKYPTVPLPSQEAVEKAVVQPGGMGPTEKFDTRKIGSGKPTGKATPAKTQRKKGSEDGKSESLKKTTCAPLESEAATSSSNHSEEPRTELTLENFSYEQDKDITWHALKNFILNRKLPMDMKFARYITLIRDKYMVEKRILYHWNGKNFVLCVPKNLVQAILELCHDLPGSGHFGIRKTYLRLRAEYYWPSMLQDTKQYVNSCPACLKFKTRQRSKERLYPNPIPAEPWDTVYMDVWAAGPGRVTTWGNRKILAFVDGLTKFAVAYPIENEREDTIARVIARHFVPSYGAPRQLVSDRGPNLNSALCQELFRLLGTNRRLVTPYHPRANGQVERLFRTLKVLLAIYAEQHPENWDEALPYAIYAYNTSVHPATGETPFYLMFGRSPPAQIEGTAADLGDLTSSFRPTEFLKKVLETRAIARYAIERSNLTNQDKRNEKSRPSKIQEGTVVLRRTLPKTRSPAPYKLQPLYEGPFIVKKVISGIAYYYDPEEPEKEFQLSVEQLIPIDDSRLWEIDDDIDSEDDE